MNYYQVTGFVKQLKRKGMLKKLKDKVMGTFKRKDYNSDNE